MKLGLMDKLNIDLGSWTIIKISGRDKKEYLNGIITFDLDKLNETKICKSMFLTPKAKIRSIFWLLDMDDSYIIYAPPQVKNALIEDLLKYKLNMNVKLEDITEESSHLYLVQNDEPNSLSIVFGGLPFNFVQTDKFDHEILSFDEFNNWLLVNRDIPVPYGINENPFEIGLANAVSLEKGCFLGQEPLSRMFHRGKPRKMMYQVVSSRELPAEININNETIGKLVLVHQKENLFYGLVSFKSNLEINDNVKFDNVNYNTIVKVGSYPNISR